MLPSSYRSLVAPVLEKVEQVRRDDARGYGTVILPEFVPKRLWHHLHNQHALLIKGALLFKPRVAVTSVLTTSGFDDLHRIGNGLGFNRPMRRLELIREEKLYRLIPGRSRKSRLEASGVAVIDDKTALVVFDNLNQVACIDLSFERSRRNRLFATPSLGSGFEDIAVDVKDGRAFGLIESVEDFDGALRGYVAEYDRDGRFLQCVRLPSRFRKANKGFEGLSHSRHGGREYLYALCEGNFGKSTKARGRIDVFVRAADGSWRPSQQIQLTKRAQFADYAALSYRDHRVAIVSQESRRLWVARLHEKTRAVIPDSEAVYRFPSRSYYSVEGIDWLSEDSLIAVSDRKKKEHPAKSADKDQSIHIFRIPRR